MLIVKEILKFLLKSFTFAIVAGIFYTISDYFWKLFVDRDAIMNENVFQRLGYYSLYTFGIQFLFGLFLLFILNDYLTKKKNSLRHITAILFLMLGLLLGLFSQGDGWELYTGDGQRIKHILLLGITLSTYPYISYFIDRSIYRKG